MCVIFRQQNQVYYNCLEFVISSRIDNDDSFLPAEQSNYLKNPTRSVSHQELHQFSCVSWNVLTNNSFV